MKKMFAIILSAMLILTMCTVTAFAINQSVDLDEAVGRLEITEEGTYILTGTLDGTVYVDPGEGDVELILDGVDINGGDQPGKLTVNDGHFSTDAMNNVDPEANFTLNGGEFFEPLPESFNMNQFGQPMDGNMPNGQQPQMGGNMPSGQQNASSFGSASEIVNGTMTNSAADLEAGVQMPNSDQNDRQQEQPNGNSQQNETPQGQNNDQPQAENNSPQQDNPSDRNQSGEPSPNRSDQGDPLMR